MIKRIGSAIYKANLASSIEYHAGGFFVRKKVSYIIFIDSKRVCLYERVEGLHPYDNNYGTLFEDCMKNGLGIEYEVNDSNSESNFITLTNQDSEIRCMPSIFFENVQLTEVTELAVEDRKHLTSQIYSQVYKHH